MRHVVLLVLVLLACRLVAEDPLPGDPPAAKGDPRIAALLKAAELKYELDKDGDFKLVNQVAAPAEGAEERTQMVFVLSSTSTLGDMELRQIWSCAHSSDGPLAPDLMAKLLEQNAKTKLGAWQVVAMGGKQVVIFCAKIPADLRDAKDLLLAIHAVTTTADDLERELTPDADEF